MATTNDWFPVLTALIGAGVGAVLTIVTDTVDSLRRSNTEGAAWQRDKQSAVIEKALGTVAVGYIPSHPDYQAWRASMRQSAFQVRLYCSPDMAAAYEATSNGLDAIVAAGRTDDERIQMLLGASNAYLQAMARYELNIPRAEKPKKAKARFEQTLAELRSAPPT
jgi:hypothetical protein